MTTPARFRPEDVLAPTSLFLKLRSGTDPVSIHIRNLLSPGSRAAIERTHHLSGVSAADLETVLQDLDRIVAEEVLWNPERFAFCRKCRSIKQLLAAGREADPQLNRYLLELAYCEELRSTRKDEDRMFLALFALGVPLMILAMCGVFSLLRGPAGMSFSKAMICTPLAIIVFLAASFRIAQWLFPLSFMSIPGTPVSLSDVGGSAVLPGNGQPQVSTAPGGPLHFLTEGTYVEELETSRFRLHVRFTLYNDGPHTTYVYDLHTHLYAKDTLPGPQAVVEPCRVLIYQDNSILRDGKVYDVAPGVPCLFDVALEVTRTDDDGYIRCVFGLFVDVHQSGEAGPRKFRMPSDAIYVFYNPPPRLFKRTRGTAMPRLSSTLLEKHLKMGTELL